jgi:outer membrane protein assembly factor BamB
MTRSFRVPMPPLTVALLLLGFLLLLSPPRAAHAADVLLSQGKPILASSTEDATRFPASAAVDGNDDWPQLGGDAGHTGFNAGERHFSPATVPGLHELRSFTIIRPASPPVLAGGAALFIGPTANGSNLAVIDATTGATRFEGDPAKQYIRAPAISGDRIYVGTMRGELCALDGRTGALRWSTQVEAVPQPVFSGPVVAGDTVFVRGGNRRDASRVIALDAATGAIRWERQFVNPAFTTPAVEGNRVFFNAGSDRSLHAMDTATGALLWSVPLNGQLQSTNMSPLAADGRLFLGGGALTAYDSATGRQLWQRVGSTTGFGPPSYAGGTLYSVESRFGNQPVLHAIDAATGADKWALQPNFGRSGNSAPAVAGGVVFIDLGRLVALDAVTGQTLWTGPALPLQYATIVGNGLVMTIERADDFSGNSILRFFGV